MHPHGPVRCAPLALITIAAKPCEAAGKADRKNQDETDALSRRLVMGNTDLNRRADLSVLEEAVTLSNL